MLLGNPVCALAYAVVVSQFFRNRIPYEEAMLLDFFPGQYDAYMRRSYILIPFVRSAEEWLQEAARKQGS